MQLIDCFLDILKDGHWHDLTETASILGISGVQMGIVAAFLQHYEFIELEQLKAKLKPETQVFLRRIKWLELEHSKRQEQSRK